MNECWTCVKLDRKLFGLFCDSQCCFEFASVVAGLLRIPLPGRDYREADHPNFRKQHELSLIAHEVHCIKFADGMDAEQR